MNLEPKEMLSKGLMRSTYYNNEQIREQYHKTWNIGKANEFVKEPTTNTESDGWLSRFNNHFKSKSNKTTVSSTKELTLQKFMNLEPEKMLSKGLMTSTYYQENRKQYLQKWNIGEANEFVKEPTTNTESDGSDQNGHTKTVTELANGADVNHKNKIGDTALTIAAKNGHLATVKYLLANGADVTHENKNGHTALTIVDQNGHTKTVTELANGADVNHKNENVTTALTIADQQIEEMLKHCPKLSNNNLNKLPNTKKKSISMS